MRHNKPKHEPISVSEFLLIQAIKNADDKVNQLNCTIKFYRRNTFVLVAIIIIGIFMGVHLWHTPHAELCKSSKPYKVKHLAVYQLASLPPHLAHQAPTSAEIWTIYQVKALWKKEAMGDTSCLLVCYKSPKVLKTKPSDCKSGLMNTTNASIATNCNTKANLNSHLTTV